MYGSTTLSAAATATAASTACPPAWSIVNPASEANGLADATIPWVPMTTGRCVFPWFGQDIGELPHPPAPSPVRGRGGAVRGHRESLRRRIGDPATGPSPS